MFTVVSFIKKSKRLKTEEKLYLKEIFAKKKKLQVVYSINIFQQRVYIKLFTVFRSAQYT